MYRLSIVILAFMWTSSLVAQVVQEARDSALPGSQSASDPLVEPRDAQDQLGSSSQTATPENVLPPPPTGSGAAMSQESANGASEPGSSLSLADVVASVYRYFPVIQQARLESGIADGQLLSSMGAYDLRLNAYSLSQPEGVYQTYRHGLGAIRQTWWGGYVTAGYRLGRGQFEPWYKERETNRGGEFTLGFGLPLLQGRAIDPQRVEVFRSGLARQAVGPGIQVALLEYCQDAAALYWEWVAAGARMVAQDELLDLAKLRQKQFEEGAEAGKYAKIDVVFNRQLVAQRASRRLDAEQKFRAAGFKLSLYLRDFSGNSLVPDDPWLPKHFPVITPVSGSDFNADFQSALARRPELQLLTIAIQDVNLDRRLAQNQTLPNLDLLAEAAQDTGDSRSSSNDKGQFELLLGIQSDVPLQRRNALGKIQQANAKISQIQEKLRLQRDKIAVELRTAHNALTLAQQQVEQMELALKSAFETLQGFRFGFQRGFTDLVQLNLLEIQTNEIELLLVDVQRAWFVALAQMQTALGLDPLEQALLVAELPESTRIGPGDFPFEIPQNVQELEADWKLHQQQSGPE